MAEFGITLPSRGLLYEGKLPEGKLTLKPLTTNEQSILYNPGGDPVLKFDQIITNCVVNSPVRPEEFLLTDRLYIMVVLRTRSFGANYKFPLRCSACRQQYIQEIDLAKDLRVRVYSANEGENDENTIIIDSSRIKEPFLITLPISKDDIEFRLLRGKDEKIIAREAKRMLLQSIDPTDPSYFMRLSLMIQKVNGEEINSIQKLIYVKKMDAGDVEHLNQEVEDVEPGIDMVITSICRACGFTDEEIGLPFTAEFFRPRRSRA